MTQLKTLEDLGTALDKIQRVVQIDELKAEAIKWVKVLKEGMKNCGKGIDHCAECNRNDAKIFFIEYFFNLTSEDLK